MKNLLIITKSQLGYLTDVIKYCEYLKDEYNITFFCFDHELPKFAVESVNVVYVKLHSNPIKRWVVFFKELREIPNFRNFDIIFNVCFELSFILKLLGNNGSFVLDYRTATISTKFLKRIFKDAMYGFNKYFFKNITVISEGLAKHFGIKNYSILPLGSDVISNKDKNFDTLKLFYIGTFNDRRIYDTINGLKIFISNNDNIKVSYDIFGMGDDFEVEKINEIVQLNKLNEIISVNGRKSHRELQSYFDSCNVGVSYVPITKYFDYQPPTKTFEYLLSGMVCLATDTYANREVINESNGILIDDNPQSFADGLRLFVNNSDHYESSNIRSSVDHFKWERIVEAVLKPILNKIK